MQTFSKQHRQRCQHHRQLRCRRLKIKTTVFQKHGQRQQCLPTTKPFPRTTPSPTNASDSVAQQTAENPAQPITIPEVINNPAGISVKAKHQAPEPVLPEPPKSPNTTDEIAKFVAKERSQIICEAAKLVDLEMEKEGFIFHLSFRYPPSPATPKVWVKCGYNQHQCMAAEFETQKHIAEYLAQPRDNEAWKNVYVPYVYEYMTMQCKVPMSGTSGVLYDALIDYGLIVMEYVPGSTLLEVMRGGNKIGDAHKYFERLFDGLNALLSIPQPPNGVAPGPGRSGGKLIFHFVFEPLGLGQAPMLFSDLRALQDWINQEIQKTSPGLDSADFMSKSQEMRLCHCDINLANFMMPDSSHPSNPIYVIDFQHVGWLPLDFLLWEIRSKEFDDLEHLITQKWAFEELPQNRAALESISQARIHLR